MEVVELIDFTINKKQAITMYLPCQRNQVLPFTKVSVEYVNEELELDLDLYAGDFLTTAITALHDSLQKALKGELELEEKYRDKGVGYYYNLSLSKTMEDNLAYYNNLAEFGLWLSPMHPDIATFIYNLCGSIWLEICPRYNGLGTQPSLSDADFFYTYQVIDLIRIDKDLASLWKKECEELLAIIQSNEEQERCIE